MPKMIVPFVDLSRQFISIENELVQAFKDVGRSGIYIMGERLEKFERNVADFCGVKYCLGVSDGSNALFLILKAFGIGPGDEVITAANSFIASAWVIVAAGATPVLVDVGEDLNINPNLIENAISPRTRAIIPVHLTGRPSKINEIQEIATRNNILVIEDAAQAMGAKYFGKPVGGLGDAAGFSLHPLKNLGVYGDGGLITTNDFKLYNKIRLLRNHGLINRDECEIWGLNSRLDSMQAVFGDIKLERLNSWNARCREIAGMYSSAMNSFVQVPADQIHEECVYHNYVIRTDARDDLMLYLKNNGVDTRVHYPIPIHLQSAAKGLGYKSGDMPLSEKFSKTMVSLPIYPELTDSEVQYVICVVISFFTKETL